VRNGFLARQVGPKTTYQVTAKGKVLLSQYVALREGLAGAELETLSKDNVSKALKLPITAPAGDSRVKELESRLRRSGMTIESNRVTGMSGVEHAFDVVAKSKDGDATGYALLNDVEEAQVLGLFVKQLDTGLTGRVVYTGTVTPEAKALAGNYSVRLEKWLDEEEQKQAEGQRISLVDLKSNIVLLQVDPSVNYETVIRTAAADSVAGGRKVYCFTWKGSPIYEAVSSVAGVVLYTMSTDVSFTTPVKGRNELLVPENDHAVLLNEMSKILDGGSHGHSVLVFDSVSDLVMLSGLQQAYEFLRQMNKLAAGSTSMIISILKLMSQDDRTVGLIKGIFSTHVVYDANGLKVTR
jgi:predicted transcriptional regulator